MRFEQYEMPGAASALLRLVRRYAKLGSNRPLLPEDVASIDWKAVADMADRHGLTPIVYNVMCHIEPNILPKNINYRLWAYFHWNSEKNGIYAGEMIRIVARLTEEGIRAIPFKGPVLTQLLHGDLAMRTFVDLDILVRKSDAVRALHLLESMGYERRAAQRNTPADEFIETPRNDDFELVHREHATAVELHWRTSRDFPIERREDELWWKSLPRIELLGASLPTFSVADTMFSLLVHGSKHLWERVGWVLDIALLAEHMQGDDWCRMRDNAFSFRCKRPLVLGLLLARELLAANVPDRVMVDLGLDARMERVAHEIVASLFAPHAPPRTVLRSVQLQTALCDTLGQRIALWRLLLCEPNADELSSLPYRRGGGISPRLSRLIRLVEKHLWPVSRAK
jgi:Uncharacterised nucleotidyltransferase